MGEIRAMGGNLEIVGVEVEPEASLIGRTIAGKFLIERLLGRGSMGQVYLGRHLQLEQMVAVKVMSKEYSHEKTFVARFEREAKASFAVAHPNIIRVLDFGSDAHGLIYLAMEYVNGGDLAGLIFRSAPLPSLRIVHLLRQALAGIAAAHDAGIVHRDLKPENIMLATAIGDDGRPTDVAKVCDFGIARLNDGHPSSERLEKGRKRLTETGLIIGTPEYMAPEQARGERADVRSDVYAMGIILYELMTGVLPFIADTAADTAMKQITAQPEPPSQRHAGIDPRLEEICMRALRKDPQQRYQSARQMRAALGAVIGLRESNDSLPPLPPDSPIVEAPAVKAPKPVMESGVKPASATVVLPRTFESRAARAKSVTAAVGAVVALAAVGIVLTVTTRSHDVPAALQTRASDDLANAPTVAPPAAPNDLARASSPAPPATGLGVPDPQVGVTVGRPALAAPAAPRAVAKGMASAVAPSPDPAPATPSTPSAIAPGVVGNDAVPPAPVSPPPAQAVAPSPPAPAALPAPVVALVPAAPAAPAFDPSSARATISDISNLLSVGRRDVQNGLARGASRFTGCYQSDLRAAAAPQSGAGKLHIETDDTGVVTSAHATGPLSPSGALCIERAVIGAQIPNVDTGQAQADIALSFDLK